MTKNLPPRAVLFGRLAALARERLAETLYNPDTVLEAMSAAAAAGSCQYVLPCPEPYDLQHTAAAVRLVELLQGHRFRTVWIPVNNPLGPDEPPFFSLVVRWDLQSTG